MLQNLDPVGAQISGHISYALLSTVSAISTLVVTTLLKLLEICDLFSQSNFNRIQTLNQARLFECIDFNITQARMALKQFEIFHPLLTNVNRQVLKNASSLHQKIKSALEELPTGLGGK